MRLLADGFRHRLNSQSLRPARSIKADGEAALDDGERPTVFHGSAFSRVVSFLVLPLHRVLLGGKFGKQIIGDEARNDGSEPEMIRD